MECADKFHAQQTTPTTSDASVGEPLSKKHALDVLLGPDLTTRAPSASDELEQYLAETPSPRSQAPLSWWNENQERLPNLAKLARVYLCVPATSTPSERVFSTAGLTVTKLGNCLKPKNVDTLIFLNKNSHSL